MGANGGCCPATCRVCLFCLSVFLNEYAKFSCNHLKIGSKNFRTDLIPKNEIKNGLMLIGIDANFCFYFNEQEYV